MHQYPLQSLRIPPRWKVTYHDFTTADPGDRDAPDWLFREDLFQAHISIPVARMVDLGWYSDRKEGMFRIVCVAPDFRGVVCEEVLTRSISEAVDVVNRMLEKASESVYGR